MDYLGHPLNFLRQPLNYLDPPPLNYLGQRLNYVRLLENSWVDC